MDALVGRRMDGLCEARVGPSAGEARGTEPAVAAWVDRPTTDGRVDRPSVILFVRSYAESEEGFWSRLVNADENGEVVRVRTEGRGGG